jgi:hypothetical protein
MKNATICQFLGAQVKPKTWHCDDKQALLSSNLSRILWPNFGVMGELSRTTPASIILKAGQPENKFTRIMHAVYEVLPYRVDENIYTLFCT